MHSSREDGRSQTNGCYGNHLVEHGVWGEVKSGWRAALWMYVLVLWLLPLVAAALWVAYKIDGRAAFPPTPWGWGLSLLALVVALALTFRSRAWRFSRPAYQQRVQRLEWLQQREQELSREEKGVVRAENAFLTQDARLSAHLHQEALAAKALNDRVSRLIAKQRSLTQPEESRMEPSELQENAATSLPAVPQTRRQELQTELQQLKNEEKALNVLDRSLLVAQGELDKATQLLVGRQRELLQAQEEMLQAQEALTSPNGDAALPALTKTSLLLEKETTLLKKQQRESRDGDRQTRRLHLEPSSGRAGGSKSADQAEEGVSGPWSHKERSSTREQAQRNRGREEDIDASGGIA